MADEKLLDDLLRRLEEGREAPAFSDEERREIRQIIEAWHMWQSWGRLGRILIWCLLTASMLAVAQSTISESIAKWFGK
jgi:hypothetical protein